MNRDGPWAVLVPGDGRPILGNSRSAPRRAEFARPASSSPVTAVKHLASCLRVTVERENPAIRVPLEPAGIDRLWHTFVGRRKFFLFMAVPGTCREVARSAVRLFAASEEGQPVGKGCPCRHCPNNALSRPGTIDQARRQCKAEKGKKGKHSSKRLFVGMAVVLPSLAFPRRGGSTTAAPSQRLLTVSFPFSHPSPFPFLTLHGPSQTVKSLMFQRLTSGNGCLRTFSNVTPENRS